MTLTLAGWIAIVLAPAILLAAAICATPYAIQAWRPCSQPIPQGELEALIDATREHPAGPCGCAWITAEGDPAYQPCSEHDYAPVAADFEEWEREYSRQQRSDA